VRSDSQAEELTASTVPARCPHHRVGVRWYRARFSDWRQVRGVDTPWPVGRKPRNCNDAHYLAEVWRSRSLEQRLVSERWVEAHTLDEQRSWPAAIAEVQIAYPGTSSWLTSCSRTEGAGRSGNAPWVANHQGSGAGGWLQFMHSTFWRMYSAAADDVRSRDFRIDRRAASWYSRLGQALAGGWAATYGATHEWSGSGC
jgi:hypothetical protein